MTSVLTNHNHIPLTTKPEPPHSDRHLSQILVGHSPDRAGITVPTNLIPTASHSTTIHNTTNTFEDFISTNSTTSSVLSRFQGPPLLTNQTSESLLERLLAAPVHPTSTENSANEQDAATSTFPPLKNPNRTRRVSKRNYHSMVTSAFYPPIAPKPSPLVSTCSELSSTVVKSPEPSDPSKNQTLEVDKLEEPENRVPLVDSDAVQSGFEPSSIPSSFSDANSSSPARESITGPSLAPADWFCPPLPASLLSHCMLREGEMHELLLSELDGFFHQNGVFRSLKIVYRGRGSWEPVVCLQSERHCV